MKTGLIGDPEFVSLSPYRVIVLDMLSDGISCNKLNTQKQVFHDSSSTFCDCIKHTTERL